jgi:hypothetical protein
MLSPHARGEAQGALIPLRRGQIAGSVGSPCAGRREQTERAAGVQLLVIQFVGKSCEQRVERQLQQWQRQQQDEQQLRASGS